MRRFFASTARVLLCTLVFLVLFVLLRRLLAEVFFAALSLVKFEIDSPILHADLFMVFHDLITVVAAFVAMFATRSAYRWLWQRSTPSTRDA